MMIASFQASDNISSARTIKAIKNRHAIIEEKNNKTSKKNIAK